MRSLTLIPLLAAAASAQLCADNPSICPPNTFCQVTGVADPSCVGGATLPTSACPSGAANWGQCGGQGFTGPTCCAGSPEWLCFYSNLYHSQCLRVIYPPAGSTTTAAPTTMATSTTTAAATTSTAARVCTGHWGQSSSAPVSSSNDPMMAGLMDRFWTVPQVRQGAYTNPGKYATKQVVDRRRNDKGATTWKKIICLTIPQPPPSPSAQPSQDSPVQPPNTTTPSTPPPPHAPSSPTQQDYTTPPPQPTPPTSQTPPPKPPASSYPTSSPSLPTSSAPQPPQPPAPHPPNSPVQGKYTPSVLPSSSSPP
ncbi:hypothetical protein V502_05842 [Pseudogymnoascus sp. VKM F-4520 (FW-2644)]|nr:hypothetical protein V502_05842 [Pseudogymnoascus sp. VKM F-4520 (FW-2644)]